MRGTRPRTGFDCVRGSTYRGGARAIWELFERSRRQHLTITPDGPRGPRRQLAQGPIYLASRLQIPLVVMGFGYDRPWRANSWDNFAVPRPFSRARAIIGPPMRLPPDLDRAGLEHCRQRVESLLNCLTVEAEAWAAAGTRKAGELVLLPQSAPAAAPNRRHAAFCTPDHAICKGVLIAFREANRRRPARLLSLADVVSRRSYFSDPSCRCANCFFLHCPANAHRLPADGSDQGSRRERVSQRVGRRARFRTSRGRSRAIRTSRSRTTRRRFAP